jgi:hypothetical protein
MVAFRATSVAWLSTVGPGAATSFLRIRGFDLRSIIKCQPRCLRGRKSPGKVFISFASFHIFKIHETHSRRCYYQESVSDGFKHGQRLAPRDPPFSQDPLRGSWSSVTQQL